MLDLFYTIYMHPYHELLPSAILMRFGKGILILFQLFSCLCWLDFIESSLYVHVIIHEQSDLFAVVHLFVETDSPPEVMDVFNARPNDLFF